MRFTPFSAAMTSVLALFLMGGAAALAQTSTTTDTSKTAPAPADANKTTTPPATTPPATTAPATPPAASAPAPGTPDANKDQQKLPDANAGQTDDPNADDTNGEGDVSIGDIPDVKTEELNPDLAKKAIDGAQMVHDKYQDSPLEDYDTLQDFVDKDPKGKQFEADVKALGFATLDDWNVAVTSVSVAYNNILDDQTADIKQQIADITKSTDMAQDMKDKAIKSLQASLPSENNTKIVQELMKDKKYGEEIKLLETTEE